ncbi:MAG: GTPase HflX [Dehalococcoidales bacterium]|nr:GTPase HflX [Dehalococcoidales bacterium]
MEKTIKRNTIITKVLPEKAFLVTVETKESRQLVSAEASQGELAQLAKSAGAEVVGKVIQHLDVPSKVYYIGKGKLDEIIALKDSLNYDTVIFDDELLPVQQRNLEEALQTKVIDRAALILDIFARRARTREGKLQVELAQHQYLLPRLAGQWSHLERLGAGIGTRGPGESQLETDRRLIQKRIQRLRSEVDKVSQQRFLYREHRRKSGIPIVALVGYTNAGKSTLLNALSQANVASENKVFTTLDPTTRRIMLADKSIILLSDTVGFIRKLPPTIIKAFRATLEELEEANLLLNVIDFASPYAAEENHAVENILRDLKIIEKPRITVLNKIDLLLEKGKHWTEEEAMQYLMSNQQETDTNIVLVSSAKKWGLTGLLQRISHILADNPRFQV